MARRPRLAQKRLAPPHKTEHELWGQGSCGPGNARTIEFADKKTFEERSRTRHSTSSFQRTSCQRSTSQNSIDQFQVATAFGRADQIRGEGNRRDRGLLHMCIPYVSAESKEGIPLFRFFGPSSVNVATAAGIGSVPAACPGPWPGLDGQLTPRQPGKREQLGRLGRRRWR
jgi:hypothetical protein